MKLPWTRTDPPPPDAIDLAAPHGGVLAWGRTVDDRLVVAARGALVLADAAVPWHLIDHAVWEPPQLLVRYRDERGSTRRTAVELARPGELPPVIRQGVTRTVVTSRRIALQGDAGAVFAARRDPAGRIGWTVIFDDGLDANDPQLQQVAREHLARLRETLGV